MLTRTIYIAPDDREFSTEDECLAYEQEHAEFRLIGLSAARLMAAMSGQDRDLADAILLAALRVAPVDPREQGRRDFRAGAQGVIPDRFKGDKASSEEWLIGWDEESVAVGKARAA